MSSISLTIKFNALHQNWEFQWYTNNRRNSFVQNGELHLRPTLTADEYGEQFLFSGTVNLWEQPEENRCTNDVDNGCIRTGSPDNIINPIKSARLHTIDSFRFKYGRVEIRAKNPTGDWLWPALWMMPRDFVYGGWPRSGEIDIMEARGNLGLVENGVNIGTQQVGTTLHFGPSPEQNGWPTSHFLRNWWDGFSNNFHTYTMEWTPEKLSFVIDGIDHGTIWADSGFWNRGGFQGQNPWEGRPPIAPFDQEFYLIMNLAVGGVMYFPDSAQNPGGKPWHNQSPRASTDFWYGRNQWYPTWHLDRNAGRDASLIVDYVRVWAL